MFLPIETGIAKSRTPASPTVRVGDLLWTTLTPKEPETGRYLEETIEGQTRQCLKNLEQVMSAAGGSLADVFRIEIFLVAAEDAAAMNAVYAEMLPPPHPSRVCVVVKELLAPIMRIEMTAMANLGD